MKIELHAHTSETSPCGHVSAEELIRCYAEKTDYDGVVITDHFNNYVLENFHIEDEKERVKRYLLGYETALKAGKQYGIKVFFGIEVCLHKEGVNDYLIYGASPEVLYEYPYLYELSLEELFQICEQKCCLLIQAHPNRGTWCTPAKASLLHGAEVYNGNKRQDNHNEKTLLWAEENHLLQTSGSDYHEYEDLASGGIETFHPVQTEKELMDCICKQKLVLIRK